MTTRSGGDFTMTFLYRVGLFAGILSVIAGILGMHVLTGTHSMHSSPSITAAAALTPSGHHSSQQDDAGALEQCSCSGNCADGHSRAVACTPSAKTGSLSAPLPGTTVIGATSGGTADRTTPWLWSYRPGSPSPGELSISRT